MIFNKNKNFCDINPLFFAISTQKGIIQRNIKDFISNTKFAKTKRKEKLDNIISSYSSNLIKKGKGVDPVLQENKAVNIRLASSKINEIIIQPGEVFSFWRTIGKVNKRTGYKEGRVIKDNKLIPGTRGGLCNLANTINNLILNSPLEIVEFHKHSDALAPDNGKRIPLANGTSVSYNYIDYRFKNNTSQNVQLLLWCDDEKLYGELRSENQITWKYEIIEENHHFEKEGDKYYRVSQIYRNTIERETGNIIKKELIWDNHSMVMFDYDLIPKELIKNDSNKKELEKF